MIWEEIVQIFFLTTALCFHAEIARELAPKSESKLKGISTTRLNPQHNLW